MSEKKWTPNTHFKVGEWFRWNPATWQDANKPPYMTISADGVVSLGPNITWDEAAEMFLAGMARQVGRPVADVTADLSQLRAEVAALRERAEKAEAQRDLTRQLHDNDVAHWRERAEAAEAEVERLRTVLRSVEGGRFAELVASVGLLDTSVLASGEPCSAHPSGDQEKKPLICPRICLKHGIRMRLDGSHGWYCKECIREEEERESAQAKDQE